MTTRSRALYGRAELSPTAPVVAGSTGTWILTYCVGAYGIDDGGTLKIAWRFASDWGRPQSVDPAAPNYCTVATDGPGRLSHRWDPKGYIRPWQKCLVIDVAEWALAQGDRITVVYGDRAGGSPGAVAQTFRERTFEFRVAVDAFGTGQFVELDESPVVEVVPAAAAKLVLIAPTQVVRGEAFALGVKVEDEWGNPAVGHAGSVRLDVPAGVEGLPPTLHFDGGGGGVRRLEGVLATAAAGGVVAIGAAGDGMAARSNSIACVAARDPYRPYWGDLHGQSEETVGTNSIEDYFAFARDVALVDFAGHQGNDFQITPAFWARVGRCARELDEPGRFVVFPGYEWSATTPAGGDRNVYYLEDGQPIHRTSHWQVAERADADADRYPVGALFAQLRQGRPALVVPHVGGRPANLAFHDPALEPVIEIYSAWGQFEWLLEEALRRGCQVGFIAGSDDHKGRPGASYPGASAFGVCGGLTCALASQLTRAAIWEALKARRCYATSGQRILLDVHARADDGPERWIGEAFDARRLRLRVVAAGTADLEELLVLRGTECVCRWPPRVERDPRRVRVVWSGARIRGRDRRARWDGAIALSGGRIVGAEGYAFDSAAEGIVARTETRVAWRSATSGDEDGVILEVEADAAALLRFESDIATFEVRLGDLDGAPCVRPAGGVALQVKVERLPLGGGRRCDFVHEEEVPTGGAHPYYVRLTQTDGARAWTSPFYVSRR